MSRTLWLLAVFSAAAWALAGCGKGGGASPALPPSLEVPIAAPQNTVVSIKRFTAADRERMLRTPQADRKARFAAALSNMRRSASVSSPGCIPVTSGDAAGDTAKLS